MDNFNSLISSKEFSQLTLNVTNYPKTLIHWENLIHFLTLKASPINKNLDQKIYKLLKSTYESFLTYFPCLENYYIDYALLEFKIGHFVHVHKIFNRALSFFNFNSIIIWLEYLKICNEIIIDNEKLFKKYQLAESHIGLHFYSGEFWLLYLNQFKLRSISKQKYYSLLRKILEIPQYSFTLFFSIWLKEIDNINNIKQLKLFIPKSEIDKKLSVLTTKKGKGRKLTRDGPKLIYLKKILRNFTKDIYSVTQFKTIKIYSLFESKISKNLFYSSPETLINTDIIITWTKYINYTINLSNDQLTNLNFQRALLPLAHYDIFWIKYANWFIDYKNDLISAKNILKRGATLSLKKTSISKLLYSILLKLNEYDALKDLLSLIKKIYNSHIEDTDDFELFWDYIQFTIFINNLNTSNNNNNSSRYSPNKNNDTNIILPPLIFDKIMKRLSYCETKQGQEPILSMLIQLQNKENTQLIEDNIFKIIIESNWKYYLNNGEFWYLYSRLIFINPSKSFLEKRKYLINEIWPQAKKFNPNVIIKLQEFCTAYLPEDLDELDEIFKN